MSICLYQTNGGYIMANVRINIAVEEETHRALKMLAVSQGKPLKEIVLEALREKAKKQDEERER